MAQGQSGAWCKVGESGGNSESLLRQWQRFFVRFSFVIGLGEGCSVTVLPQHSRQEVASSCEGAQRHMSHTRAGWWECELQEHLAGGKDSGLPLSHCSAAAWDLQLCLWMLW